LAVDDIGGRHLLLPIPEQTAGHVDRRSKGLVATTESLVVGGASPHLYIDLRCDDTSSQDRFDVVVRDVLSLRRRGSPPAEAVRLTLGLWRRFWGSAPTQALSRERQRGLIGELWFLGTWLLPSDARAVDHWLGPQGAHHDFQWPTAAVEVKATLSEGHVHHVNRLDQLQEAPGSTLYVLSLRMRQEQAGRLTLPGLVERISTILARAPQQLDLLEARLADAGYSPFHGDEYRASPVTLLEERLFVVEDPFPRLTEASLAGGMPAGVLGIEYDVDFGICMERVVASDPAELPNVLRGAGGQLSELQL
jgi:hypothetical protein